MSRSFLLENNEIANEFKLLNEAISELIDMEYETKYPEKNI